VLSLRGLSTLTSCILIICIVCVCLLVFYYFSTSSSSNLPSNNPIVKFSLIGSRVGPGYAVMYVEPDRDFILKSVLIYYLNGSLACIETFPGGLYLKSGVINTIPIISTLINCVRKMPDVGYVVLTGSRSSILAAYTLNLKFLNISTLDIAYFIDESSGSKTYGSIDVDTGTDTWDSLIFYISGSIYFVRCIGSSSCVRWSGRLKVLPIGTSILDLKDMSWSERYSLGPVVVVINPTYGTKDWTFTIIDINGVKHVYTLSKVANSRYEVVIDMLILLEDLWHPNTKESLDDYRDSIVRITVYINNTARLQVLEEKGDYLHAFFLNPKVSGDVYQFLTVEIPREVELASKYLSNGQTYFSPLGLKYFKPFYIYSQILWISTNQLINPSTYYWLCNLETGRCIVMSS